jgi:hypothetical protein
MVDLPQSHPNLNSSDLTKLVDALLLRCQTENPEVRQWSLHMRPQTYDLLEGNDGTAADTVGDEWTGRMPGLGERRVVSRGGREVWVQDLIGDVIIAGPVVTIGGPPGHADAPTYWLDVETGTTYTQDEKRMPGTEEPAAS